jgi:hypothetical protein
VRLVDNLLSLGPQGFLVATPVVTAELQVGSAGQQDANVRLSTTSIAAIFCAECWGRKRRSHGISWSRYICRHCTVAALVFHGIPHFAVFQTGNSPVAKRVGVGRDNPERAGEQAQIGSEPIRGSAVRGR